MKRKLIIGTASTLAAAVGSYMFCLYGTALVAAPVARLRLTNDRRQFRVIQRKQLRLAKREAEVNKRILRHWSSSPENVAEMRRAILGVSNSTQAVDTRGEPTPAWMAGASLGDISRSSAASDSGVFPES